MNRDIRQAVRELQRIDPGIDAVEVAELLWLAQAVAPEALEGPRGLRQHDAITGGSAGQDEPATVSRADRQAAFWQRGRFPPRVSALASIHQDGTEPTSGELVCVHDPAPPVLQDPLQLMRALRPLNRRAADAQQMVLDEEATARHRADFGFWLPIARPADRRWLDLVLVTDASPSMDLWRSTAEELLRELARSGIFGNVHHRHLVTGPDLAVLTTDAGHAVQRDTREVISDAGNRVILVLTDGVDPFWRTAQAGDLLRSWAQRTPTAILQPLPERLWPHTAFDARVGTLVTFEAGAANTALRFIPATGTPAAPKSVPVPVLELRPDWLAGWAALVGGGTARRAAVLTVTDHWGTFDRPGRIESTDLPRLIRRFRASASPTAVRLAMRLAAAAPLTLPIIRYVQRSTTSSTAMSDIAEVLLGGLLLRISPVEQHPDTAEYDFVPGAREQLLGGLRHGEAAAVSEALLTAYLNQTLAPAHGTTPGRQVRPAGAGRTLNLWTGPLVDVTRWRQGRRLRTGRQAVARVSTGSREPERPPQVKVPIENDPRAPVFFLSYARGRQWLAASAPQEPDRFVRRLFDDLTANVHELIGSPAGGNVGFIDLAGDGSEQWQRHVLTAAGTCQIFVSLLSKSYFQSQWCAREWDVFSRRPVVARSDSRFDGETAILPVLWAPFEEPPPQPIAEVNMFSPIGLPNDDVVARYHAEGLLGLIRTGQDDIYDAVVWKMAMHIQRVHHFYRVEPSVPSGIEDLRSSFTEP